MDTNYCSDRIQFRGKITRIVIEGISDHLKRNLRLNPSDEYNRPFRSSGQRSYLLFGFLSRLESHLHWIANHSEPSRLPIEIDSVMNRVVSIINAVPYMPPWCPLIHEGSETQEPTRKRSFSIALMKMTQKQGNHPNCFSGFFPVQLYVQEACFF